MTAYLLSGAIDPYKKLSHITSYFLTPRVIYGRVWRKENTHGDIDSCDNLFVFLLMSKRKPF